MSELEKLVIAISMAIFLFIFSDNIGRLIYGPIYMIKKAGYNIKVEDSNRVVAQAASLPEVLDMHAIMSVADPKNGENIFKKVCTLCHNGDKGGPNKVGPNLWGVYNGPAAHKDDFNYSDAIKARRASEILWDEEQLYRFLYSPKQYVPGTKMSYVGIKDDKERADVISYLETLK
jgi:cytochrome c